MNKIKNINEAIEIFEKASSQYEKATLSGDYKVTNNCYSDISNSITFLKTNKSLVSLLRLLNHPSNGVRLWAATYLLSINPDEAIKVLDKIANESNILSLDAKTTLKEWRSGNLKL